MGNEKPTTRKAALDRAIQQIEKSFGQGAVMQLAQRNLEIRGISTGSLSLDLALGGKGLPRGRIVELFGPESSGKTTLALHVIACAQADDGICAFVDAEHALDPSWSKRCGVLTDKLLVSQPNSGEEALEITEMLVRSNAVDVIVVDSVAALIPRAEIEGEMGDTHVALQARLMSQALRKLTAAIAKSSCIVIFINQVRMKIGVMFGSPETTPGGRALKFYSSVRLDVRRIATLKEGDVAIGNQVRCKVVKNKVAAPFKSVEFDIMFDSGMSREGDVIDLGIKENVVRKTGAWFSYGEMRLGQGRENSKQFLRDNPDLFREISKKILEINTVRAETAEAELNKRVQAKTEDAKPSPAPDKAADTVAKNVKMPTSGKRSSPVAVKKRA